MDNKRILELAIETLQTQKKLIEGDIAHLRREIARPTRGIALQAIATSVRPRRAKTAAARKAQSIKMKAIWAARKDKAQKPANAKKSASTRPKLELRAANKARSEKMKAYWAKKRGAGTSRKSA